MPGLPLLGGPAGDRGRSTEAASRAPANRRAPGRGPPGRSARSGGSAASGAARERREHRGRRDRESPVPSPPGRAGGGERRGDAAGGARMDTERLRERGCDRDKAGTEGPEPVLCWAGLGVDAMRMSGVSGAVPGARVAERRG